MQETEITVEVFDDVQTIDKILKEKNFFVTDKKTLNDFYYTNFKPEELKNIKYTNLIKNSFLVRNVTGENFYETTLCYKNKIIDENENVIAEEKTKSEVENLEKTLQILNKANITNWCNLKQDMIIYSNNQVEFAVQIVENLGVFIEFEETEEIANWTEVEKIKYLVNYLKSLGLKLGNDFSCKKPYMMLNKKV
ncbi:MAG: hypothetical protein IKI95_05735 [Clostridia bacterium]|nr:hypothetical protein [Clostridia bacterium]